MNITGIVLLAAFSCGLAGGFAHCIGMCGVFVLACTPTTTEQCAGHGAVVRGQSLFQLGRLVSLGALGLAAAVVGTVSHRQIDHQWAAVQAGISISAGLFMVALAIGFSGLVPALRVREPDIMNAGGGFLRRGFRRALASHSPLRPLLIGLFVGLLPCGLTYMVLVGAFALRPLAGLCLMLSFGLGTVPGLLLLGSFASSLVRNILLRPRFRARMTIVSACITAVLGLAFVWRGVSNL